MRNNFRKVIALMLSISALATSFTAFAENEETIQTDPVAEVTETTEDIPEITENISDVVDKQVEGGTDEPEIIEETAEPVLEPSNAITDAEIEDNSESTEFPNPNLNVLTGQNNNVTLFADGAGSPSFSGTCGNSLTWTLDILSGTLTISGTGDMQNYTVYFTPPWYEYRENIKSVVIEYGATELADYAFSNCTNLTSVTLPSSLKSVGACSFYNCTSLKEVVFPDSVTQIYIRDDEAYQNGTGNSDTFVNCTSLTTVVFGSKFDSIFNRAFNNNPKLTDIYIKRPANSVDLTKSGIPSTTRIHWQYDLSSCTVSMSKDSYTYTGKAIVPASSGITVTSSDGTVLEYGKDYTITASNNINVGTATVKIVPISSKYAVSTSSKSASFTIAQAAISSAAVSGINSSYTYTGSAITPTPTIKLNSKTLTSGTDYTVSYSNNTNPGTATLTITGKGNYTGTVTKTFTVSQTSISGAAISGINSSYTYTGNAITPAPTVKINGKTFTENTDYTVSYSNNTNLGTATLTITGKGNYTGTVTKTFTISRAGISDATVSGIDNSYVYTGSAITPAPTVKANGRTLTENTDYTVRYSNNTNPGTATLTITGKGNYTGSVTKTFTISQTSISEATVSGINSDYAYFLGYDITPAPTVVLDGKTLTKDTDYTVSYSNNINIGTATVTISGKGEYAGTITKTFTISPLSISNATQIVGLDSNYTYTGSAVTPTPIVMVSDVYDNRTLITKDTDYTVSYSNNTNIGTATVTITGKGNYTGTVTKTFTISQASISSAVVSGIDSTYAYTGSSITPKPTVTYNGKTLTKDTDYTVEYSNNTNIGTATVTISGKGNYEGNVTETFTISQANISSATVTGISSSYAYTGSSITPVPLVRLDGTRLIKDIDYTVKYSNNTNRGTATVTITGRGNYTGTYTKTFTISRASVSDATVSGINSSYTFTGSAITPAPTVKVSGRTLTENTDYTVVYSDNTNPGTATITITGKGNYTSTCKKTFEIIKNDISDAEVSGIEDSYCYTKEEITPEPTVVLGGITLTRDTDYTVEYSNNVNLGTATVTITGMGVYVGTITKTFEIEAISLSDAEVTFPENITWNGTAVEPEPTVILDGKTLTKGTDYTVTYSNNVFTADDFPTKDTVNTATATITGIGSYIGSLTKEFEVEGYRPDGWDSVDISLGDLVSGTIDGTFVYNGTEYTPTPKLVYHFVNPTTNVAIDYDMVEGEDFEIVSYEDNINAGEAIVTVEGIGAFKNMLDIAFDISPCELSATTIADIPSFEYCKKDICPDVEIKVGDTVMTNGVDYELTYENNRNRGTATVTITGKGNLTGVTTKNFEITPRDGSKFVYIIWL